MELLFHEESIHYLDEKRFDLIYQEQTAEMILPEGKPGIGRIIDSFGMVLVQSKTVDSGTATVNGGVQAGVLYVPEDGEEPEKIDVYVPFTVSKKLQTGDDAQLFYWGWLKSIDARLINNRKILVRVNLGSELTLLTDAVYSYACLDDSPRQLQRKAADYRMRLPLAAAEKEVPVADEVMLPEQESGIDRLLKWTCGVEVTDSRLIGDKAVFKGNVTLRCLYQTEDGSLNTWSGSIPYSQYADLDREIDDGFVSVQPILRRAELETDGQIDSHRLLLNMTFTAQLLVRGDVSLRLTEDAYCTDGELDPQWQTCDLTPCLDRGRVELTQKAELPQQAAQVLDWTVCADAPVPSALTGADRLTSQLSLNLLYRDEENALQSMQLRQEAVFPISNPGNTGIHATLEECQEPSVQNGELQIPLSAQVEYYQQQAQRNLCGGTVRPGGSEDRPSVVIARCSGPLWDVAKEKRTSVAALMAANGLDCEELEQPRLLLVPLGQAAQTRGEDAE